MRLLLDTHAWVWGFIDRDRISSTAEAALVGPDAELWLSPISIWETLLLGRTRRLNLQPDPLRFVLDALKRAPFASVPVTREIALRAHDLEGFSTDDPADRLLVATALEHDLTLVTADAAMRAYAPVKTLW